MSENEKSVEKPSQKGADSQSDEKKELPDEALARPVGEFSIMRMAGQVLHGSERVIPECLDLDRLTGARSYNIFADLRVHPR